MIEKIDKNLKVETSIDRQGIKMYDAKKAPFTIYGLVCLEEDGFKRMPDDVSQSVSEGVASLSHNTSGGRVVFSTDSPYVAIKMKTSLRTIFHHMPQTGVFGFDLYTDEGEGFVFYRTFIPPLDCDREYESILSDFPERKMRKILIHFPLYNDVDELYIGVDQNAKLMECKPYLDVEPIVYYGSSITQGACASRPGNNYPAIISRKNHIDFTCLGFSGNAHGEQAMAVYISTLPMSCFVMCYDHNDNAKELSERHYPFYETIRRNRPEIPILMISAPNLDADYKMYSERRAVIYQSYKKAKEHDDNVYYIDGEELFGKENRDCATVDSCHPNDYGFVCIANVVGKKLAEILS